MSTIRLSMQMRRRWGGLGTSTDQRPRQVAVEPVGAIDGDRRRHASRVSFPAVHTLRLACRQVLDLHDTRAGGRDGTQHPLCR